MVQPVSSKPALSSVAALLRGDDPEAAWAEDIGALRTFAEACDGERPWELVEAAIDGGDLDALEGWLRAARSCEAPGLEDEAGPWLEQAHAEARLGLLAVKLLRATARGGTGRAAQPAGMGLAGTVAIGPPREVSVMGPRCSFRPGDRPGRRRRVELPTRRRSRSTATLTDRLVRHALGR